MAATEPAVGLGRTIDGDRRQDIAQQRRAFVRDYEGAPLARWSRLPNEASDLTESDIRYTVRIKSREPTAARSSRRGFARSDRDQDGYSTGSAGKRAPAAGDKLYFANALLIGILAGLAIPSAVVLIAVLIVNPSAISIILSKLFMAIAASG